MSHEFQQVPDGTFPLPCQFCGKPATCEGTYEGKRALSCDDCCGHGCEDGRCDPVETGQRKWLIERLISSSTLYWNGRFLDDRGFVADVNEAVGFACEQDGSIVLHWLLEKHGRVALHLWSGETTDAREQNNRLAADSERLNYLEQVGSNGKGVTVGGVCYWSVEVGNKRLGEGDDLREAIDDARSAPIRGTTLSDGQPYPV